MDAFFRFGFDFFFFGIPVTVSWGSLILAALVCLDAIYYIKKRIDGSNWHYFLAGLIASILTIASIAIHELAHGLVATLFDVKIKAAGIWALGAYVMPESPGEIPAFTTLLITLAGPASNFLIAGVMVFLVWKLRESMVENTVQYVSYINWRLAKWNMLPIFILDGGQAASSFLRLFFSDSAVAYMMLGLTLLTMYILLFTKREKSDFVENKLEAL